ncbi:MAG: ribbon-helix-helix protein, CopG family [SAR202 cluster bacterium]|nr:ribbon-helix-helix protein, CopG family [SAR202 cluster bacterium]
MRTTIRLNDELLREAKKIAAESGTTLTSVIEDALREALARRRAKPTREWITLPTDKGGGVMPGVDLNDSKALWELTDKDHAVP